MKFNKDIVETKARELFGVGFDALSNKEKQSWFRSAIYRLNVQTVIDAVDNAVENEATTKGWDNAHQGAWEMSAFYAEEASVAIDQFRKYMLKKMRGHFTPKEEL